MQLLSPHPFAEIYPVMDAAGFDELVDSIRRNGLREPIVLHRDGSVLDGRHRLRACVEVGVSARFVTFGGNDGEALEYVVDTNSHRRHLTPSARSLVAARLVGYGHGGKRNGGESLLTHRQAAQRLNVGERSVRDGKLVLDYGSYELVADVERGEIAVRTAAELIRATGKNRQALVAEYHRLRRMSGSAEWYTPPHILKRVTALFGTIDLDPASNTGEPWVDAREHFTTEDNGLSRPWTGRIFLNPPWDANGSPARWVEKLATEYETGNIIEAVCLLPARVNTVWINRLASYPRCFVKGRLRFSDAQADAPFPVVLVYLGDRVQAFADTFADVGPTYGLLPTTSNG